ncbi:MAG: hypothetical protein ACRBN8_46240 [Nannocystales bacterium]
MRTTLETASVGAGTPMHWKRLAQRKLRQVLELLDDDDQAGLGEAFELVEEAGVAIDELLQRREVDDG